MILLKCRYCVRCLFYVVEVCVLCVDFSLCSLFQVQSGGGGVRSEARLGDVAGG